MGSLAKTIADVRAKITQGSKRSLNEQNTKAALIEPVLRALGWDVEDFDEVIREFRIKPRDKPVDYGLLVNRTPRLFVEAKPLNENLDDRRWANQIMGYASVAGVEWIVLTNGDEYRIYNAHAPVAVEEKLFRKFRVSAADSLAEETLSLLAKDRLEENALAVLWRAQFVDSHVKAALEHLFAPESDMLLVNHVERHTKNLTAPEIRASLGRCRITLDFPIQVALPQSERATGRRVGNARPRQARGPALQATLQDLLSHELISAPCELVCRYRGKQLKARLEADGRIRFGGELYTSPSLAGGAARVAIAGPWHHGRLPSTNGWTFWQVKQPDGSLVTLADLRARLPGQGSAQTAG